MTTIRISKAEALAQFTTEELVCEIGRRASQIPHRYTWDCEGGDYCAMCGESIVHPVHSTPIGEIVAERG